MIEYQVTVEINAQREQEWLEYMPDHITASRTILDVVDLGSI